MLSQKKIRRLRASKIEDGEFIALIKIIAPNKQQKYRDPSLRSG